MASTYITIGDQTVGTLICDRCGVTWSDGVAETIGSSVRMRAPEGWRMYRPNEFRADDLCPDCPAGY